MVVLFCVFRGTRFQLLWALPLAKSTLTVPLGGSSLRSTDYMWLNPDCILSLYLDKVSVLKCWGFLRRFKSLPWGIKTGEFLEVLQTSSPAIYNRNNQRTYLKHLGVSDFHMCVMVCDHRH